MDLRPYYYRIVNNIYKAESPYEILSNIDNLKYINEIYLYKNKKRLKKNGIKTLK